MAGFPPCGGLRGTAAYGESIAYSSTGSPEKTGDFAGTAQPPAASWRAWFVGTSAIVQASLASPAAATAPYVTLRGCYYAKPIRSAAGHLLA